jgi:DNA-binding IclR family transcriptional regulator
MKKGMESVSARFPGCLRCFVAWVTAPKAVSGSLSWRNESDCPSPPLTGCCVALSKKAWSSSIEFFALAAKAGNPGNLRDLVRPSLLRLSASLGDSLFLLARSGFDAICLDRSEGPYPIRTFTGDIGGRVALGVGQGSLAILAFLPEEERETVIRYNLPRLKDFHLYDEVLLRSEIDNVRRLGYASRNTGALPGMAGLAVPILDRTGRAVAALSVATISDRLGSDRLQTVVELLKREASAISAKINPFDPSLRRPSQVFGLSE